MKSFKDQLAYGIALCLIAFFERIPFSLGLKIGDFFGKFVFYFSEKRRTAYINLKTALGDQLTPKDRWRIIREHYGHVGQSMVEVMSFRKLKREDIDRNIKIHHLERFNDLLRSGRGGVLLTAHYGNWELLQVVAGILGTPIHVLARDQKYPRLNELLNQLRESHGSVAISRGVGVRYLIRALRDKKLIGLLGDQSAGKTEGIILPFFGRKTTVPTGAFELALRTHALVMPCFMIRKKEACHEIEVGQALEDIPQKSQEERVEFQARRYLEILEEFIRKYPDQWLWENKRWKYSWTRKILILSDGKAGHFKQSEAIAELLREFKTFHGRSGLEFQTERIEVRYRSKTRRKLFFLLAPWLKPWIQGRLEWLRFFFTPETQEALKKATGDFIVAAGAGLAPLQMCLAQETGAKKIVIMNPPFPYSLAHYDLAVIPAHDSGVTPQRVHRSVIMPSGYHFRNRDKDIEQLKERLHAPQKVKIAIFLGGAAHDYDLTVSDAEKLCSIMKRIAEHRGDFMLTTSRRTSSAVERFLKTKLSQEPSCQLLVIANENNPSYVSGGMMGLADILIVTEDSLAMISEAVGTGKRVIVLSSGRQGLPDKHYRFHKILSERGLATLIRLEDLDKKIDNILNQPPLPVGHHEKEALLKKLEELL